MILRFATRPDLDIFSNNEAERTIRPAKVQQRSSGGCWRTLTGLAEFALVQCRVAPVHCCTGAPSGPRMHVIRARGPGKPLGRFRPSAA